MTNEIDIRERVKLMRELGIRRLVIKRSDGTKLDLELDDDVASSVRRASAAQPSIHERIDSGPVFPGGSRWPTVPGATWIATCSGEAT